MGAKRYEDFPRETGPFACDVFRRQIFVVELFGAKSAENILIRVRELSILYISHNVTHVYVLLNDSCYIEVKCGLALFGKMSIN